METFLNNLKFNSLEFQIISDIHIERQYPNVPNIKDIIQPVSETLILAGDIGRLEFPEQYFTFLKTLSSAYKNLYLVPGNNEYYSEKYEFQELKKNLKQIENNIPNLKVLDDAFVDIGNFRIYGTTLWSNIPSDKQILRLPINVNGTKFGGSGEWVTKQHINALSELEKVIKNSPDKELIIVSHYPPTINGLAPKHLTSPVNSYYHNNLKRLFENKNINTWVFGHSHVNRDYYEFPPDCYHISPFDLPINYDDYQKGLTIPCQCQVPLEGIKEEVFDNRIQFHFRGVRGKGKDNPDKPRLRIVSNQFLGEYYDPTKVIKVQKFQCEIQDEFQQIYDPL